MENLQIMKLILAMTLLTGSYAMATNINDYILTSSEISTIQKECVIKDSTNPGVIACNKSAILSADAALHQSEIRINALNTGVDAHGRDLGVLSNNVIAAGAAFTTYMNNECVIEVYSGGAGTGSDNVAAFSKCELRIKLERLQVVEKIK
jgi:hypothetical protein